MQLNKQYASTNYWSGNKPRSIILHTTGGDSVIGAVETLIARGLSYNYIIKNGTVHELVSYKNSAWHAGVVSGMNMRSQVFFGTGKGEENPNRNSVGIAFAQSFGVKEIPDEDIDACILLIKHLGQQTGVRYNADNIFYHREVTSYKPLEVKGYREQVLDALVGDKDDKDAGEKTVIRLTIQLLKLKVQLLHMRLLGQRNK